MRCPSFVCVKSLMFQVLISLHNGAEFCVVKTFWESSFLLIMSASKMFLKGDAKSLNVWASSCCFCLLLWCYNSLFEELSNGMNSLPRHLWETLPILGMYSSKTNGDMIYICCYYVLSFPPSLCLNFFMRNGNLQLWVGRVTRYFLLLAAKLGLS